MAKAKQMTTPIGVAYYPHLRTPDVYQGIESDKYSVQLKCSLEDTNTLIALIEEEARVNEAELKNGKKFNNPYLGYKTLENGDVLFTFKTKTGFVDKTGKRTERTVPIFDAKGVLIAGDITYGSKIKISFSTGAYFMSRTNNGLSLYLNAVQVIEMSNGTGSAPSSMGAFGFGTEEGYSEEVYKAEMEEAALPLEPVDEDNPFGTSEETDTADF